MPPLALPALPLSDGVIALRDNHASQAVATRARFEQVEAPLIRRAACEHLPDVFFARLRDR